jgi:hypothetical protein
MMQLLPHPYQLIQHWSRNKSINQHRINGLAVTPTGRVVLACQVGNHHWGGLHWPRGGGGGRAGPGAAERALGPVTAHTLPSLPNLPLHTLLLSCSSCDIQLCCC